MLFTYVRQVWKKWHPPLLDAADVLGMQPYPNPHHQKIHELIMAKMCSRLLAD